MDYHLVVDWMTRNPHTVSPDTVLLDAYQLMKNYEIRRLPVLQDGEIVGIITMNDIRSAGPVGNFDPRAANEFLAETPVSEVMTANPVTIAPDATVAEAAQVMYENKFGGLPVVKGRELIGIISESDLFRVVMVEAGRSPA